MTHLDLPRPFRMSKLKREEDTPQMKAVREAFANAIIHSDVFLSGGVLRIDKYDDRLCLRNPGTLKLPIEQIYEGGTSRARNPRMQNMLRMIGYGENLGSGFPLILTAWKDAGWEVPVLKNKVEIDEVELELPITTKHATANATANGTVNGTANGTVNETVKLNKTQKSILSIIHKNKFATYEEIAQQLGMARSTIGRNLDIMKKNVIIRRIGGDKNGYWEVLLDMKNFDR